MPLNGLIGRMPMPLPGSLTVLSRCPVVSRSRGPAEPPLGLLAYDLAAAGQRQLRGDDTAEDLAATQIHITAIG
jgi:hypothetical protein